MRFLVSADVRVPGEPLLERILDTWERLIIVSLTWAQEVACWVFFFFFFLFLSLCRLLIKREVEYEGMSFLEPVAGFLSPVRTLPKVTSSGKPSLIFPCNYPFPFPSHSVFSHPVDGLHRMNHHRKLEGLLIFCVFYLGRKLHGG